MSPDMLDGLLWWTKLAGSALKPPVQSQIDEMHTTYLKIVICERSRHPREVEGPFYALKTWIPASAGMTSRCVLKKK
jgi:cephalosporin hydroxylase